MKTDILHLNKSPYENGQISGRYFKNVAKKDISRYGSFLKDVGILEKCSRILAKLKASFPDYYDEVRGKADGLGVTLEAYFVVMCPEILNLSQHCTTIMCKKENGSFILSHNEDGDYIEGNFCISKVLTSDNEWFVTNDMYDMPFGNGFSWNSHGILKTIDYCYEPNTIGDNLPRYFLQRHISEATSLKDLISRCSDMKPASGFHINALDINNNAAASIEVYPDSVNVELIDDCYIHSNHYVHQKYQNNIQFSEGSNSVFRLQKATELLNSTKTRNIASVKKILDYRDSQDRFENSIFQTKSDPYITCMNLTFDVDNKNEVLLDIYTADEKLRLDYDI